MKPKPGDDPIYYKFSDLVNCYIWRDSSIYYGEGVGVLFKKDEKGRSYFLNRWINQWSEAERLDGDLSGQGGCADDFKIISEEQAKQQCEIWGIDPQDLFL